MCELTEVAAVVTVEGHNNSGDGCADWLAGWLAVTAALAFQRSYGEMGKIVCMLPTSCRPDVRT